MEDFLSQLDSFLNNSGYTILKAIIVAVFGILIIRNLLKLFKSALIQSKLDNSLVNFVVTIVKFVLALVLILICFGVMGIPITGMVSAISAVTLAIGLSIQSIIASVANGLMIVSTHPFKVDDYVQIGSIEGTVKELTMMHTILTTPDNKCVMLPNSTVFTSTIINYSTYELRRQELVIDVDSDSNLEQVRSILMEMVKSNPRVLAEPAPTVRFSSPKSGCVTFTARCWCKNDDFWTLGWELGEQCRETFNKNGIVVPNPQMTLTYKNGPASGHQD